MSIQSKKIPITIAIPALNEEANIEKLIRALLNQDTSNYVLADFVIISDGSTDGTVSVVKNIQNDVRVVDFKERKGKSARLNDILHKIVDWDRSEAVILFDADTLPVNQGVVNNLVKPFIDDSNSKLVSGKPVPLSPGTFFEKVLMVSAFLQNHIKKQKPQSVFTCHGRSLAMHKQLAKKITVPEYMVGNDAFIYFSNKINKFKYVYAESANVYYRMPASFKDFKKQFIRFKSSQDMLKKYFGDWIDMEYKISKKIKLQGIFWSFIHYPMSAPIYYISYIIARFNSKKTINSKDDGQWDISNSTKKL